MENWKANRDTTWTISDLSFFGEVSSNDSLILFEFVEVSVISAVCRERILTVSNREGFTAADPTSSDRKSKWWGLITSSKKAAVLS